MERFPPDVIVTCRVCRAQCDLTSYQNPRTSDPSYIYACAGCTLRGTVTVSHPDVFSASRARRHPLYESFLEEPYSRGRTMPFPPGLERWRELRSGTPPTRGNPGAVTPGAPPTYGNRGNRGTATPDATFGGGILPAQADSTGNSYIPPLPFFGFNFAGQPANASPTYQMFTQQHPPTDNAGLGPLRTSRAPSPRVEPLPDEHRSYDASDEASYSSFTDIGSASHSSAMDTDDAADAADFAADADADNAEEVVDAEEVEEEYPLADIPPIAFTTTGETLLLGEEFIVPTAEEAHREAGPRVGPGRIISRQETVDERGRRTSVVIDEMAAYMDVTMRGARQ
ncbi:hypothetical protein ABKA04_006216 [Annulohypoxylon sp. FPYF3050]